MRNDPKLLMLVRVIDDDEELRESFKFLLEGEGWFVRTYPSAEEFLLRDNLKTPGFAFVDIRMEGMSGLELQQHLIEKNISLPLVFVTAHGSIDMAVDALRTGAIFFLQKPVEMDRLREALELASQKADDLQKAEIDRLNWNSLTSREKEVAQMVAKGLLNKQVAGELNIAERTVQTHRTSIYRKLGVRNAIEVYKLLERIKAEPSQ